MGKYGLTSGMIPQKYAHTIGGGLNRKQSSLGPPKHTLDRLCKNCFLGLGNYSTMCQVGSGR